MTGLRSLPARRIAAFAIDTCVLATWGGLVFAFVMLTTNANPPRPGSPWTAQAIGFLCMTAPALLYGAVAERCAWCGTLGKRVTGLRVETTSGVRLTFLRALLRNGIKFTPWECGHTVAHQATFAGDAAPPLWLWLAATMACLVPIWWIINLGLRGETPFDRWTRTRVTTR